MRSVLITGGTGTFGNAFVRHVLAEKLAERIVVFSRDEWKQAEMARSLGPDPRLRFFLGDVRDFDRLCQAFQGIDTVVHAAALKRVDAIAYNPGEVLRTNVIGTENVCRAAISAGVEKVVFLSSDKAVHPQNVYGVSKAMGEHIVVGANVYGIPQGTALACVRYGNVLGSRGSVLSLWREQLAANKPLTLTDTRMTRFWLTPAKAVSHVLATLAAMQGGEIFLPWMSAASLQQLAYALSGDKTQTFTLTGLRPGGEKLHERLLSDEEALRTTMLPEFFVVAPHPCSWTVFEPRGTFVAPDFIYSSETADRLTFTALSALVKEAA